MTTINPTLPQEWRNNKTYNEGDTVYYKSIIYRSLVNDNLNKEPKTNEDYWKALDIYMKDETVMEHGQYSGDAEFWERDNVYIDTSGWVYINNENTGINVRGPAGELEISFSDLTPEQIEQIRGLRGVQGPVGPQGPAGPEGPMGQVVLTDEQIAVLKGEQGKSAYQVWLDEGHTGTEEDYLLWLQNQAITIDTTLNSASTNPVQNRVITDYLTNYDRTTEARFTALEARVAALESQLSAVYGGETIKFQFGITENGKYGYIKNGMSDVIPFDTGGNTMESMYSLENGFTFTQNFGMINTDEDGTIIPISETEISDEEIIQPTSFTRSVSNNTGVDDTIIVSNNITSAKSITDTFDTKYYIFDNHIYTGINGFQFTYPNMTYTDNQPLITNPRPDGRSGTIQYTGIVVSPYQGPMYYSFLYVTVENIDANNFTELYYINQITPEQYDSSDDKIGTAWSLYHDYAQYFKIPQGETRTLELTIDYNKGLTLAAVAELGTGSFRITEMYYK